MSDPWADVGYEPHQHGPPPAPGMPTCPWCGHRDGHELNTGRLGGLLCGACGNQFTSAPGEFEAMASRRALWAEEIRGPHDEEGGNVPMARPQDHEAARP